jgi:Family of unknown function (DUF6603)
MAGTAGTLETIARQIGLALQPLEQLLASANVTTLFAQLGTQFPPQLVNPANTDFINALNAASAAAGKLTATITQLTTNIENGNDAGILQDGVQLIQEISDVITAVKAVGDALTHVAGLGIDPGIIGTFAENLVTNLLGYLLISYVEGIQPGVIGVANLLGAIDYIPSPGVTGDPTHPPFTQKTLQLSRLGDLFKNPSQLLNTLYQWGAPGFDGTVLIPRLATSLQLLGISSTTVAPGPPLSLNSSFVSLEVNPASTPPGLTATLETDVPGGFDLTLPLSSVWSVHIFTTGTLTGGLAATIVPPASVTLKPLAALNAQLESDLLAKGTDSTHPIIILGQTDGSRLQADSFTFGMGVSVTWDSNALGTATVEPQIKLQITKGKVVIDMSKADGFLAKVLSGIHVEGGFDLTITWAPDTGIHITGGAQLEIDLPLHLSLGPVTLPTLYLVAGADSNGIPIEISAALGLTLGPIQVAVDRVGLTGLFTFPDHGGNLGPVDLALGFKPPNGLGLAIDAGVVAGGGYIAFYPDKKRYAGVFDLSLAEIIQVKIIGVLDTILPDGTPGFSFLLIITFNFPPIQLSFGFTLNGVGGLGGVNRTMNTDALHAGFRAHTLNPILFPPDPIANAPQIITSIENFFPPAEGRYLFGPMLELGWGTPTLITFAIGIILEVPDPVRLVLLGLIDAGLPTMDAALVELHIDVLGVMDFGAKTLAIDGSLYDSRVLIYSVMGDLALRLSWGDNPNFLLSLGGFNPHFNTVGLDVPSLHRLTVSIGDGDNPRISANSYFAITSNSLQFGSDVEAYASAAGFTIHGYLGWDVLIIYSPFSFEVDFSGGFDASFEGHTLCNLTVHGVFTGPRPWHLHGDASIDILFFSVSASISLTWGDSTPATVDKKKVLPDLTAALGDARNWSAALPDRMTQAATFSTLKPDDTTLRVHPVGTLTVKENVVPLDLQITKYGNAEPADGNLFSISDIHIDGTHEDNHPIQDYFAAGQFLTLSDADKISSPSFEKYDAGVTIGSSEITSGADSPRVVSYKTSYIPDPNNVSVSGGRYLMPANIHLALVKQGAGYASPLKNTGLFKYSTGAQGSAVKIQESSFVITSVEDLSVRSDIASAGGTTFFQARAALDSYLTLHPEETENLQIISAHEVGA